ncbi:dTMP kinase [Dongshaea marina]|uniref:dTMP kinase n=1 Tax=Dongshaea marina TaxID=2047966 RepID=UPI000D3E6EDA|nr:dTMP kinase [Dongshaea marina]
MKAKFIVVEGLEGAGKSSLMPAVVNWLEQRLKVRVITTREPGGTKIAEQLRSIIKHGIEEEHLSPMGEVLLLYAARLQLIEQVIKPALEQEIWVVGDRHDFSTLAYQGAGRSLPFDQLKQVRDVTLGDFRPDLTLYLDLDPELGMQRARSRGELDRIERQHIDFFHRARARYQQLVAEEPKAVTIDASQTPEQVQQSVLSVLEQKFC